METLILELAPPTKFIWRIPNFSCLNLEENHYSTSFFVGDCKWQVGIVAKDTKQEAHLSMFLIAGAKLQYAEFSFEVVNQINSNKTVKKEGRYQFIKTGSSSGFRLLIPLRKLEHRDEDYLVNDACSFRIEISSCKMMEDSTDDDDDVDDSKKGVSSSKQQETELQAGKILSGLQLVNYPGASKPFPCQEGKQNTEGFLDNEKYEDIGGFNVLKKHASLYKQIWLKYGHIIASNQVASTMAYIGQVWLVTDIMNFIMDMHQCRLVEVSSEMIDSWENKIKMAEHLDFNIKWLRERFEDVKKGFYGIQKFKTALQMQDHKTLHTANAQMIEAKDEYKKAQARLVAAKSELLKNLSDILSESELEIYLEKGENLLFDGMF